MADNVAYRDGNDALITIASDDVSGIQMQKVKLDFGGDGASTPVTATVGLPVSQTGQLTGTPPNTTSAPPVRVIGEQVDQCSFADVGSGLLTTDMTQRKLGTGVTVSQSAGNLVIAAGTTANSEFLARSVIQWQGSWRQKVKSTMSGRIANNNFLVMMADMIGEGLSYTINSATSITVTKAGHGFTAANVGQFMMVGAINTAAGVPGRYAIASIPSVDTINFTVAGWPASGSGTLDLFGWNHCKIWYKDTTVTSAVFDCQRKGWASGDSTVTVSTTTTGHVSILQSDIRTVMLSDMVVATSTAITATARGSRIENIPDDGTNLYLYLWSYNGTGAPAGSTSWTVGFFSVERFAKTPVYIAGTLSNGLHHPLPVALPGTQAVNCAQMNGVNVTMGNGTAGTGVQRVAISSDNTAFTVNTGPGTAAGNACTAVGFTALTVASVKASPGNLFGISVVNKTASALYIQLYNTSGVPTLGTSVIWWIPLAASQTIHIAPGAVGMHNFATGIGIGASTTPTSTGTPGTAPEVVVYYK
jgi:hypothetical protein